MALALTEIARMVGGDIVGDETLTITGVNGVKEAGPGDLTFIRSSRYLPFLEMTQASAVLVAQAPKNSPLTFVVVAQPDLAFAQILQHFSVENTRHPEGRHARAIVDATAMLGDNVSLDANAHVAGGAQIGSGCVLYPGVYVGRNVRIGRDCIIYPNAVIREDSVLGDRCIVHAGATIGSDGFGFAPVGGQWMKIPQIGRVVIGDDVEVGSNTCIDRATFGETVIGNGTKIDNLVQIGHNVVIGEHCVIAGKTGIAGSAVLGNHVRVGAQAGINGHITIGDGVTVGARAGVTGSIEAAQVVSGFPAIDHTTERRVMVARQRVPELLRRVRQLERALEQMETKLHAQAENDR